MTHSTGLSGRQELLISYYKGDVSEARKASFRWISVGTALKGQCHLFLASL